MRALGLGTAGPPRTRPAHSPPSHQRCGPSPSQPRRVPCCSPTLDTLQQPSWLGHTTPPPMPGTGNTGEAVYGSSCLPASLVHILPAVVWPYVYPAHPTALQAISRPYQRSKRPCVSTYMPYGLALRAHTAYRCLHNRPPFVHPHADPTPLLHPTHPPRSHPHPYCSIACSLLVPIVQVAWRKVRPRAPVSWPREREGVQVRERATAICCCSRSAH
jgi:hypothetical protein